ncbi:hypothetical protein EF888_09685 [Silicimonas algicola]|uniref:PRC-barrel domain protein n=1 Tax=Silicimonas algicola TaxID=1826607 RepID=A0A316G899_9RHOB|nr:PRC-barrel domain-containing protein [Silicimonas algicola]AZQ67375.1 hypothetical protein EF888_09685 [Silicimonas algicola]PWK57058.1 PRC-barrel domain protein [Silicimonas algicola]
MKRFMTTTAIVTGLMAGTAFAQDAGSMFRTESNAQEIQASEFMGKRVYAAEGGVEGDAVEGMQDGWEDVGEINDIILGRDGSVEAVLVDIGGFLGMGERQVALNMDQVQFVADESTTDVDDDYFLVISASRANLEEAPEYSMDTAATGDAATEPMTETDTAAAGDTATEPMTETDTAAAGDSTTEPMTDEQVADEQQATNEATAEQPTEEMAEGTDATAEQPAAEMAEGSDATAEQATEEMTAEAEQAGDAVVEGAETAGEEVAEAADATGEAVVEGADAAGDELAQAADATGEAVAEGTEEVTAEAEQAGDAVVEGTENAAGDVAVATDSTLGASDGIMRDGYDTAVYEDLTAEDLTGARVYDGNDEWIGEVSELLLSDDGQISGAVVDVGGFLGLGEKPVELSMDELDILREQNGTNLLVYIPMTKEELEALPTYEN